MEGALFRFAGGPADFEVDELPLAPPAGEGRFLLLLVEKCGLSTEDAIGRLAHSLGVPRRAAAHAGRKDVHALTRQWMSFEGAESARAARLAETVGEADTTLRILDIGRHSRGLALGASLGNRFAMVLRDLAPGSFDTIAGRLGLLVQGGAPARFGDQRFGAGGANAAAGLALLRGDPRAFVDALLTGAESGEHGRVAAAREAVRAGDLAAAERLFPASYVLERQTCRALRAERAPLDIVMTMGRRELAFLVNAAQSALFNAVLERRSPALGDLIDGDVAYIHRSRGSFPVEDVARERERAERFEISPTGPLFGRRMRPKARAAALDIEQAVLAEHHLDDDAFERHIPSRQGPWRVDGARRPLRWPITDARLSRIDDGAARLEFALPPGGYATEVVRALGGEIVRP